MEAKHTPGPWRLIEDFDAIGALQLRIYTVHADVRPGHEFRGVARMPAELGDEMLEANARLIAAAPDLLAFACYAAGAASGQHADPLATLQDIAEQARAAIAKAEGR